MSDGERYRLRLRVLEDVEKRLRAAVAHQDRRAQALELCERAWVKMGIRDLWEIGGEARARWDRSMREDARRAGQLADELEAIA